MTKNNQSHQLAYHCIRDGFSSPREPHALTIVTKESKSDQSRNRGACQRIQFVAGLFVEGRAIDSFRAPELNRHGLAGAVLWFEAFGLHGHGFAGQGVSDVSMQVTRVQVTTAINVARGAHTKTEVGMIRPVDLIVPALPA